MFEVPNARKTQTAISHAKEYGAERVHLFGSYACGDMTGNSDIDLRIDKGSIRGLELVGKLTDDFREQYPAVSWRQIKAMRNIIAHSCGSVDPETAWEIIASDIPDLKRYCQAILKSNA